MCDIEFLDTLFLRHLSFPYSLSDLIEIYYARWKHLENVSYFSFMWLHIRDRKLWLIKSCAVFLDHPIYITIAWLFCITFSSCNVTPPHIMTLSWPSGIHLYWIDEWFKSCADYMLLVLPLWRISLLLYLSSMREIILIYFFVQNSCCESHQNTHENTASLSSTVGII